MRIIDKYDTVILLFSFEFCTMPKYLWERLKPVLACYFLLNFVTATLVKKKVEKEVEGLLFSFEFCVAIPVALAAKARETCYFLLNFVGHSDGRRFLPPLWQACYFLLNFVPCYTLLAVLLPSSS